MFKENVEKLALKRDGHSLVDRIKWKGYSKDAVYYMLAKELMIEEKHAHFGRMNTLRELRPAVAALQRIFDRAPLTDMAARSVRRVKKVRHVKIMKANTPPVVVGVVEKKKKPKRDLHDVILPRPAYLKAMEELKKAQQVQPIAVPQTPKESWLYTLFKKLRK